MLHGTTYLMSCGLCGIQSNDVDNLAVDHMVADKFGPKLSRLRGSCGT